MSQHSEVDCTNMISVNRNPFDLKQKNDDNRKTKNVFTYLLNVEILYEILVILPKN